MTDTNEQTPSPSDGDALNWISESKELPIVGEAVLLAHPRQADAFWDFRVCRLLIRHEDVSPAPVEPGMGFWPTDYAWDLGSDKPILITGNSWWARLSGINLPPLAEHFFGRFGDHCVKQTAPAFIEKSARLTSDPEPPQLDNPPPPR